MAKLIRALSADGSAMAMAIDSTDIVSRLEQIHKTSAVITAAAGRLSTAASMMGTLLKAEQDTLTLRVDGGGPAGDGSDRSAQDRLTELQNLYDRRLITREEYEAKRQEILKEL